MNESSFLRSHMNGVRRCSMQQDSSRSRLRWNSCRRVSDLRTRIHIDILFRGPNPVFIDLLSFERRDPHDPMWLPHAQFTRMFLLPLLAYKYYGVQLSEVFTTRRDGLEHDEVYRLSSPLQRLKPSFLSLVSMPTWLAARRNPDDQKIYQARKLKNPEQAAFILESTLRGLQRSWTSSLLRWDFRLRGLTTLSVITIIRQIKPG